MQTYISEKAKAISSGKKERVEVFAKSERSKKAIHMVMPYILALLAVFMVLCFVLIDLFPSVGKEYGVGYAGEYLRNIMCGLFGFGALSSVHEYWLALYGLLPVLVVSAVIFVASAK